jgi:diphosphomevalonate decarboxylase
MTHTSAEELTLMPSEFTQGKVTWQSPSNIALIKYWGKRDVQIPMNPSVSFTLKNCYTEMTAEYTYNGSGKVSLEFYFEGKRNEKFEGKIRKFLESQSENLPYLTQIHLKISSQNTFPHSAGIASSASSMSALALCICSIERNLFGTLSVESEFLRRASELSRLASGSASRSIYGGLVTWGKINGLSESSDEYASPLQSAIHPIFKTYRDTVIICDSGEKSVSSRAGHGLMNSNPFAERRFQQANENMAIILKAIEEGDTGTFGRIVENEALTLHAMMMTSDPYFILMKPKSLEVIDKIVKFREQSGTVMCYTLDAGPNIHLLYPENETEKVKKFIESEISLPLQHTSLINDLVGNGPVEL